MNRPFAFAALLALLAGCAGTRIDTAPLVDEVRRIQAEARTLAGDPRSESYLALSVEKGAAAEAELVEGRDESARLLLLEARGAGLASIAAAVAERRETEAESCRRRAAEARRDWENALHQLEQMERVAGRQSRGITRTVSDRAPGSPLPDLPEAPPGDGGTAGAWRAEAGKWMPEAKRLGVPAADLEAGWTSALHAAEDPQTKPEARPGHLRRAGWSVVTLAQRVRAEVAGERCREDAEAQASLTSYRDHILWAMVEMERGMKENARKALEDELQRMEDRQQQLFESLQQFEGKFATIRREARGTIMSLSDILFDFDKSVLRREAEINLAKVAVILMQYSEMQINVEGHTDNIGTEEYNQALSERRAKAVYDFLAENGVDSARMDTVGYGMSQPVASNTTDEGRQQNRRVDLVIREE